MSVSDYQSQVDDVLQTHAKPYWEPLSQMARLSEEVGELARALNHKHGDKIKKPTEEPDDIQGELGDILINIICIANTEGISLDDAFKKSLRKMTTRDKDRFPKKQP